MRKVLSFLLVASLAACAGSGANRSALSTLPATRERAVERTATPQTWNVGAGASTDYYALQDLDFYPETMIIDEGDSITWHVASGVGGDAHTITFLAPGGKLPSPGDPNDVNPAGGKTYDGTTYTSSGIEFGGQTYTLTFTKAGTYRYYCLFHEPAMEGTVIVQKAGTPYPHDAQYYLHAGEADEWVDLNAAAQSVKLFPFKVGGTTLAAGISPGLDKGPPSQSTVLRFFNTNEVAKIARPENVTVKVGTTITWVNVDNVEPHTVTFAVAGQNEVPNIPPDPGFGGHTYDGTHVVNSGTFLPGGKFWLTFTKPGVFFYGCLYHDNSRMVGTITVTK